MACVRLSAASLRREVTALVLGTACIAAGQDAPGPTSRPAGETVRVLRSTLVESGRRIEDVPSGSVVQRHPEWGSWATWGLGTRVIARNDEVDAEGRIYPLSRTVLALEAIDQTMARVVSREISADGTIGEPSARVIPAQSPRAALVLSRGIGPQTVYWRHYDARVAFGRADEAASAPEGSRRAPRRRRGSDAPPRDPREAIPAEFDCAIVEIADLDLAEDPGAPDDPALARPGTAVTVRRIYHSVDAPGWVVMVEVFTAKLGEDGNPVEMDLVNRWRIERILRPGEPDPTLEQLREGLRPR